MSGCAVGPNYNAPKPTLPTAWSESGSQTPTNAATDLAAWWKNFHDAELDSLVSRAASSNYTLQAAQARVKATRALRGAVLADFYPTLDGEASYTVARLSKNSLTFQPLQIDTTTYRAGFDASWELDVFGGKRRALESASATLGAVIEDQRDVQVSLLAEVAVNYLEMRGSQRRVEIARENIEAQREAVNIAQLRFKAGLSSELDVAQATALLSAIESQIPTLESSERQYVHHLGVLLGQPPGKLLEELSSSVPLPPTPPEVPVGLPSQLLLRRPDIRRSERQLASANAQIGIATAELFPKFSLVGSAGYQSLSATELIAPGSKLWSAGPTVTWRLLEYPRLRAAILSQSAQQEQALDVYYQTVLTALEDVENALIAYGKEEQRRQILSEGIKSNRRSLELANDLYTKGLGEFLNVLDAQRSLYLTEDQLAQSEQNVSVNLVALYKALGGGWQLE